MLTSFAQALEDVVLYRALGGIETGFYIDVGANDPIIDSVTKLFYEKGWWGINIEPSQTWFQKVVADRPRDINLNIAVSDRPGVVAFHEIEGSGLSTMVEGIASRHESSGMVRKAYEVPAETLSAICEKYAPQTIHFLKIDVEGAEEHVLRGMNLAKYRPWIVLVEATEPLSDAPSYYGWDPLLTQAGYDFVLFDGLNRFYVAEEKAELKPSFSVKGDVYQTAAAIWTLGYWRRIAGEREVELARISADMARIGAEREAALRDLSSARQELAAIKNSRWWKARTQAVRLAGRVRGR